jgi:hypothetical protein
MGFPGFSWDSLDSHGIPWIPWILMGFPGFPGFSWDSESMESAFSPLSQQRLNHVIIPHIHKDKLDLLDLKSVCSDFISKNENGKHFVVLYDFIMF